jgi:Predicted DNA alkylation repair enzyme
MNVEQVLDLLKSRARPDQLEGMARFAIRTEQRLGLSIPDLRKLAKEISHDHQLALELWQSGIPDARVLASMLDVPNKPPRRNWKPG